MNIIHRLTKNQIIINQAHHIANKLGIVYVGQLINEFKFPSTDYFREITRNIINECSPLFSILVNRKNLTYGTSYRDTFFLVPNSSINEHQFTTKLLRQCLFRKFVLTPNKITSKTFSVLNVISHPKEREISFFKLHDVLLSNEKLYNMKLAESPNCPMCEVNQSSHHIFYECCNSSEAADAISVSSHLFEQNPSAKQNIIALINRLLFLNRNKKTKSEMFIAAINNRIADLEIIQLRKISEKNLSIINKISLS